MRVKDIKTGDKLLLVTHIYSTWLRVARTYEDIVTVTKVNNSSVYVRKDESSHDKRFKKTAHFPLNEATNQINSLTGYRRLFSDDVEYNQYLENNRLKALSNNKKELFDNIDFLNNNYEKLSIEQLIIINKAVKDVIDELK